MSQVQYFCNFFFVIPQSKGHPMFRLTDVLMQDLKHLDINPYDWTAISTNGDSWYVAIHKEQDIDRKKYLEKLERRLSL